MIRRWLALASIAVVLAVTATLAFTSPPGLLSIADWLAGGGAGSSHPASGVAFGTQSQSLSIWAPRQRSDKPRPVVIFWYGGGWVKGDREAYAFAGRAFARAGFVVVIPDYRKVPSVRFPAFIQDGAEAVKWVRDHIAQYGGEPNRIALAGHSAGAYTVAMLALDRRWLVAEGVDPAIVKAAVGLSGPYDFYPFDKKRSIDAMAGVADPAATQPINFVRADAPPMLLVTSTNDTEVRPKNAINLAKRLAAVGARVTLKNYPGLSHEDIAMALSVPFRGKGPILVDSIAFLKAALPQAR